MDAREQSEPRWPQATKALRAEIERVNRLADAATDHVAGTVPQRWYVEALDEIERLRGASEQLAAENAHMRVDRAAKDQEAVVAFHTIKRLRKELVEVQRTFDEYRVQHVASLLGRPKNS